MMTPEILQTFCSTDATRGNITRPFTRGDKTYATNGKILIVTPKVDGIPILADHEPPASSEVDRVLKYFASNKTQWVTLPELPSERYERCELCNGKGETMVCKHCDGEGEIEVRCSECGHLDRMDCKACHGSGSGKTGPVKCEKCGGEGKIRIPTEVKIGKSKFDTKYLSLLLPLKNLKLAHEKEGEPLSFTSDDGYGLLMPRAENTTWKKYEPAQKEKSNENKPPQQKATAG